MARCVISKDDGTINNKIWNTYTCRLAVNTRLHYVNGVHIIKYATLLLVQHSSVKDLVTLHIGHMHHLAKTPPSTFHGIHIILSVIELKKKKEKQYKVQYSKWY